MILKTGQKLLKNTSESKFIRVETTEYIKPVIQVIWFPLLATISTNLNEQEDKRVIQKVLEGFVDLIYLTGYYQMTHERDAVLIALTNYCQVDRPVVFLYRSKSQRSRYRPLPVFYK